MEVLVGWSIIGTLITMSDESIYISATVSAIMLGGIVVFGGVGVMLAVQLKRLSTEAYYFCTTSLWATATLMTVSIFLAQLFH